MEMGDQRSGEEGPSRDLGQRPPEAQLLSGLRAGPGSEEVAGAVGWPDPCLAWPGLNSWPVPQVVFLVATIQENAGSFLKDLNFADELPYSGCLATKFKRG